MDGGSKIPGFVLPTLHAIFANNRPYHRIAFLLAAYDRYLKGTDEKGTPHTIVEPNARHLLEPVIQSDSPLTLVKLEEVVGAQIPRHQGFIDLYLRLREQIDEQGVVSTLESLDASRESPPSARA